MRRRQYFYVMMSVVWIGSLISKLKAAEIEEIPMSDIYIQQEESYTEEEGTGQLELITPYIKGHYYDWTNVEKVKLNHSQLSEVAAVWEEDMLYLYVLEKDISGNGCSFTWNTYFEWTSDHGKAVSFRAYVSDWGEPKTLSIEGYKGAEGIGTPVGNAYLWEVKFPISTLGNKLSTIALKWYQGDEVILTLKNPSGEEVEPEPTVKPEPTENPGQGNVGPIVIDGYFEDWDAIPHGKLTYSAWNGTCEHHAALYTTESKIYGHIEMDELYGRQMPLNVLYLYVNGQPVQFSTHYRASDNTIDWGQDGKIYNMSEGISEGLGLFYDQYPPYYLGEAVLNVKNGSSHAPGDELEFEIDLEVLAKITGIPVESMSHFELKAPNIGAGSITTVGTSTGPLLGVLLSGMVLSGYGFYQKKRKKGYE